MHKVHVVALSMFDNFMHEAESGWISLLLFPFFVLTSPETSFVMSVDLSILTYMKKGQVGVDPEPKNLFNEDRNASALANTGKMLDNKPESLLLKSPDPEDRTKHGI